MPSIRIGLSTDFNLTNELVGINTTVPSVRLDVRGQILSQNTAGGSGISTLTTYDGFLDAQQRVTSNITISQTTKGNLNSLSGEIILDEEVTVTNDTPLTGGRLDSLTVTGAFDLPHGGTASRETTPEKGSTRFNQDLGQLEFYTGTEWRTTASYDGSGRGRGVFPGGNSPTNQSFIGYVNISTLGNEQSFGNLTAIRNAHANVASETRGVFGGGYVAPSSINTIDYITIAAAGNSIDFGDLTTTRRLHAAVSSSTRGVFGNADANVIDYIQIATVGNAVDFGDALLTGANYTGRNYAACGSPTRGVFIGGTPSPGITNMRFITISSLGNTTDFGNQLFSSLNGSACSNSVRGVYNYGQGSAPNAYTLGYITLATTGFTAYFAELNFICDAGVTSCNQTRGLFAGGSNPSTFNNTISYVSFATTGNAQDFGDLSIARSNMGISACSDSHGGLGGF